MVKNVHETSPGLGSPHISCCPNLLSLGFTEHSFFPGLFACQKLPGPQGLPLVPCPSSPCPLPDGWDVSGTCPPGKNHVLPLTLGLSALLRTELGRYTASDKCL